jgi:class 3 adenylate cyclase
MSEVIRAYQRDCAEVIRRWDGHVAKYMGDGVLAYYGGPRAHEDDASGLSGQGLSWQRLLASRPRATVPSWRLGSASRPGRWWSASYSARVRHRRRRWSARPRT